MRKLCGKGEVPASVICKAFFDLLNEYKVSDRTYSVVRTATLNDNETQIELSRGLRQLWNSVLSAVKTIYDCLKDEPISLRQFYELYRVMLSQLSVSAPPQKLDCVRIVDASHSRLSCVKIAFLCQVNDGVFPKSFSNNGLLSHIDISCLLSEIFVTLCTHSSKMDKVYIHDKAFVPFMAAGPVERTRPPHCLDGR